MACRVEADHRCRVGCSRTLSMAGPRAHRGPHARLNKRRADEKRRRDRPATDAARRGRAITSPARGPHGHRPRPAMIGRRLCSRSRLPMTCTTPPCDLACNPSGLRSVRSLLSHRLPRRRRHTPAQPGLSRPRRGRGPPISARMATHRRARPLRLHQRSTERTPSAARSQQPRRRALNPCTDGLPVRHAPHTPNGAEPVGTRSHAPVDHLFTCGVVLIAEAGCRCCGCLHPV